MMFGNVGALCGIGGAILVVSAGAVFSQTAGCMCDTVAEACLSFWPTLDSARLCPRLASTPTLTSFLALFLLRLQARESLLEIECSDLPQV